MSTMRFFMVFSLLLGLVGFVLASAGGDRAVSTSGSSPDGNVVDVSTPPDPPPMTGDFEGPEPIHVEATTGDRPNEDEPPPGATQRWGRTHSSGDLVANKLKNASGNQAFNFHARILRPDDAYIKIIETDHPGFTNVSPNYVQGDPPVREASVAAPGGPNPNPLGAEEDMYLGLNIVDGDGNPLDSQNVLVAMWWTTGPSRSMPIKKKSTENYGDDDPPGEQGSIIPDYDNDPVAIAWSAAIPDSQFSKPMMSLAECFGHQFKDGSLLFRPAIEVDFVIGEETTVRVFNEHGVEVTGTAAMSVANMRVDCDGNFVIDIARGDTVDHLIIVVYELDFKLRRDFTDEPVGTSRRVDVGGAAIGGDMWNGAYRLFELTD